MIVYNNKFNYVKLQRIDSPSGRKYVLPDGSSVPSVTTILDATTDKSFLTEWRESIGDEEADKIVYASSKMGTNLHNNLENHLLHNSEPVGNMMTRIMTKLIIQNGFSKLNEFYGTEINLYVSGLYAGTTDLIASYCGEIAIIDYKNARKMKSEKYLDNYYMQLCAYSLAHDTVYNTDIKRGVIFMADHNGKYGEFVLEGRKFAKYKALWCNKVDQYYAQLEKVTAA